MSDIIKLKLFAQMYRIRAVEEEIARRYPLNKMRCPVHLSIGQEVIPAVFAENIRSQDFAISTHRGHAHYLAKGGNLTAMLAEIYGKATGCSRGKGGSMHLIDLAVNFMGTSAIVGNSIPVGVGLGLSIQLKNTDQISCVFLGDGAVEEGVFYESINFAALRKLPVLFICENNHYSVYSPLSVRQPNDRSIARMVEGMGIKVATDTGSNLLSCNNTMKSAIDHVREFKEPFFLEFETYRWREHCGPNYDNDIGYRSEEEFFEWKERDPLLNLEKEFLQSKKDLQQSMNDIKSKVNEELNEAIDAAEDAPFPNMEEAYDNVYA